MHKVVFIFFLFSFLGASCQQSGHQTSQAEQSNLLTGTKMPAIDQSMQLPNELIEISGLTYDASANVLIGHDDELGILYFIDFDGKRIDSKLKIGDIGDFEGVELVDDKIYLINSQGDVLEHRVGTSGSVKFKTGLNASNNVEGLCYKDGQLLIALKGKPEMSPSQRLSGSRVVYAYSLEEQKLIEEPYLLFPYTKLRSFFNGSISAELENRLKAFAPSGIAIHPETKDFYILSFKGGLMLVCNEQAEIKDIYLLDGKDHRQPEGICFDKQNRLYIANEARKRTPVIHRYKF